MPTDDAPLLRLIGVCKHFDRDSPVLRDVDLRIDAGERVALLGESGSGKSTLLNLIAGLEKPDAGRILFDGQAVETMDERRTAGLRRRRIGFVFQAFHLLPYLDAQRNVALPLLLNGVARDTAWQAAGRALDRLGLARRRTVLPAELSGGEQQRVALARALIHRPALVLADEPTGNLDPSHAATALRTLTEHIDESGAALLMVTHSMQAAAIAQRRVRLVDQRLVDD
ncbi:MAG: ABC transporter ATP-binding protein [Burkholderiaceae bacterium]